MAIKDKRKAAAHATAARLLAMKAQVKNPALNDVEILENNAEGSACEGGVMLEDSDCEYEGGVNCYWTDSDGGDYFKLDPEDFDGGDYSDTESLEHDDRSSNPGQDIQFSQVQVPQTYSRHCSTCSRCCITLPVYTRQFGPLKNLQLPQFSSK
jgi:hypothetical protein